MTRSCRKNVARRGAVLLIVVVVLLLVSLAITGLVSLSQSEMQATKVRTQEMVLENLLLSGENVVAAFASLPRQQRSLLETPSETANWFRTQHVAVEETGPEEPSFSILPVMSFAPDEPLSFGPTNESSKLNLRTLLEFDRRSPGYGERALLELPGMTPEAAASIMDWLDADEVVRQNGAEIEEYLAADASVVPANAIPAQLEELALVANTTWADWFNEVLPSRANERASGRNAEFHPGWLQYLTLHSRERNESVTGQPRVHLNDPNLQSLHSRLTARVGKSMADFVVQYRQYGPAQARASSPLAPRTPRTPVQPAPAAGLDFRIPARFTFASELDLVGGVVAIRRGAEIVRRIESPLSANRTGWAGQLEQLMDKVTVDARPVIEGRINIDVAPREVLLAIPEIDPVVVDQILTYRQLPADGRRLHTHSTWLLEQGVVDLARMKKLMPYVTTGGDVFQANIVACDPVRLLFFRELVVFDGSDPARGRLYCKSFRDSPLPFNVDLLLPERLRNETTKK
ncbi:MAG: hypothetical protein ABL888_08480 [Pirellulaceae bacterium]